MFSTRTRKRYPSEITVNSRAMRGKNTYFKDSDKYSPVLHPFSKLRNRIELISQRIKFMINQWFTYLIESYTYCTRYLGNFYQITAAMWVI